MIFITVQLPESPTVIKDMAEIVHRAVIVGGRATVEGEPTNIPNDLAELSQFVHDPDPRDRKISK